MKNLVGKFIDAANAFDIEGTISLFAPDATIDDVSVGEVFVGRGGVRDYLERFFVGYNTATKLISVERLDGDHSTVLLDFTGDFGHEIGILKIAIDAAGLIRRIEADLQ